VADVNDRVNIAGAGINTAKRVMDIYAWTGDKDRAIERLMTAAKVPNGAHYGQLKLNPQWDPLRGDPRFEQIVASLAPKN